MISCPIPLAVLIPFSSAKKASNIGAQFVIPPDAKLSSFMCSFTVGGFVSLVAFTLTPPIWIVLS